MRASTWVALGAAGAAMLAPLYADGSAARPANWWPWAVAPAVAVAVGVIMAGRPQDIAVRRRASVRVMVLAAVLAALAIWLYVADLRTGTPGGVLAVLAGCALVVTASLAVTMLRPTARHRPVGLLATVAPLTLVLVTGAGLLLAPLARALPEHSATAVTMSAPAAPQLPTRQDWQVQAAQSRNHLSGLGGGVVPAGAGIVTALGYPGAPAPGLAGVDGVTGDLRWSYSLGDATPSALVASPDGAHVVAVFTPRTLAPPAGHLVVLDAMTGEPLWSTVVHRLVDDPNLAPSNTALTLFANELLPVGDPNELVGLDLATGDVRWRTHPADGCRWGASTAASTATAALLPERCDDRTARLVALDQQTGIEKWRYTTDLGGVDAVPDDWGLVDMIRVDPTGSVVKLHRTISGLPDNVELLLRGDDGRELVAVQSGTVWPAGPIGVVTGLGQEGLILPSSGEVAPMDLVGTDECRFLRRVLTTDTAMVRHCRDAAGEPGFLLVQRAAPGTEVSRIDVDDAPDALLVAPGALVTVQVTSDTVTYTGYRDA